MRHRLRFLSMILLGVLTVSAGGAAEGSQISELVCQVF